MLSPRNIAIVDLYYQIKAMGVDAMPVSLKTDRSISKSLGIIEQILDSHERGMAHSMMQLMASRI